MGQSCIRRVWSQLSAPAQLVLRNNPKLQIAILREDAYSVWAYFPVYERRTVVRDLGIQLKATERVLLVISETQLDEQSVRKSNADLRHHLGHTFLYLRSPRKPNGCEDAWKE